MHSNTKRLGTCVLGSVLTAFMLAAPSAFAYSTEPGWVTNSYFKAEVASGAGAYINGAWTLNAPAVTNSTAFAIDSTQTVFHVTENRMSDTRKVIRVDCDINFGNYYYLDDVTNDVTSAIAAISLVTNEEAASSASWMILKEGDKWVNVAAATPQFSLGDYQTRIELDYTTAAQPQVRYQVKASDGEWTVLKEGDTEWFNTAASALVMSNVCFCGKATLSSIDAKLSTTAAAEVNGQDFADILDAMDEAKTSGKTIVLYQDVAVSPSSLKGTRAGTTYNINKNEKTFTVNASSWKRSDGKGVEVTDNGSTIVVSAEKDFVAQVGYSSEEDTAVYLYLAAAFDAASAGDTVLVLKDVAENATMDESRALALDLAEFALKPADETKPVLTVDGASAQLFVFNGSITGAGASQAGISVVNGAKVAVDDIAITNNPVAISATGASEVVITNGLYSGEVTKDGTGAKIQVLGGYFMDSTFENVQAQGGQFTEMASNSFATAANNNALADGYKFAVFAVPFTTNDFTLTCSVVTNVLQSGEEVPSKVWTITDDSGKESIGGVQISDEWISNNTSGGDNAARQADLNAEAAYGKTGAKVKKWEAYVLGMTSTTTSEGPTVKGISNASSGKVGFSLLSPAAIRAKESGCDVKFSVTPYTNPGLTSGEGTESDKVDYTGTVELDAPTAAEGVRYYKLKMYISPNN